jgi:hypothetical protein
VEGEVEEMFTASSLSTRIMAEAERFVSVAIHDYELEIAARYYQAGAELKLIAALSHDCDYKAATWLFPRASQELCHYQRGIRYAKGFDTLRQKVRTYEL